MKKVLCLFGVMAALTGCNDAPKCDNPVALDALRNYIQDNIITVRFMGLYQIDEFNVTKITQRPSKVSNETNVCTGYVSFDMVYLPGGGKIDGGQDVTYTVQKTLDNQIKVDLYQVGSVKVKTLHD